MGGALGSGIQDGRVFSQLENTFFPLDSLSEIEMSDKISRRTVELVAIIKSAFIIRKEEQNKGKESMKRKSPPSHQQWEAVGSSTATWNSPLERIPLARLPAASPACSTHTPFCKDTPFKRHYPTVFV